MKKVLFLLAFLATAALGTVQAQSCHSKASVSATSNTAVDRAAEVAAQDASIEKKTCAESGTVSYMKKSTCKASGKVTYTAVNFDETLGQFVNVSPSADKGAKSGAACCAKSGAEASTTGVSGKKSCTAAEAAGCCDKKGGKDGKAKATKVKMDKAGAK